MSQPLTPNANDQAMIHAMGLLSRPALVVEHRDKLDLAVNILRSVLPGVQNPHPLLAPLVRIADDISGYKPIRPGCYGSLHDTAWRVMNEFDAARLAAAWDRIRGEG